ncbi:MAG TPA: GNAT family N-acetyltransferase [Phycisphaerae bacterium]|nr:GNAT family N-acetyltransferase [Phycisphaerae bacterium]
MLIRPAIKEDFPAIAELTNDFIRSTAVHFAYEPVSAGELEDQWRETRVRFPWFTAEINGRFAGYAKAGPWRTRAAYQWTAEVGIYIEAVHRGSGVGKRLYTALIDELRERGFHSAVGGMTQPNDASARLHERLGFEFVGSFREAGRKMGEWHDVAFWQLLLRDSTHCPV